MSKTSVVAAKASRSNHFELFGLVSAFALDASRLDLNAPLVHRTDRDFPVAWTRTYGKGRVFHTPLGHVWRDVPARRNSRSCCRSASDNSSPGGQPSTTQPIAGPWLSPKVVTRKRWPKVLNDIEVLPDAVW